MTSDKAGGVSSMQERMSAAELLQMQKAKRPRKYRNQKIEVDGQIVDSKAEAARLAILKLYQQGGMISDLVHQYRVPLMCGTMPITGPKGRQLYLVADFRYIENGKEVLEDTKGFVTAAASLKAAIVRAMGYKIRFVRLDNRSNRGNQWVQVSTTASRRRRGKSSAGKT